MALVFLHYGARVDRDGFGTGVLAAFDDLKDIDIAVVPAQPRFDNDRYRDGFDSALHGGKEPAEVA